MITKIYFPRILIPISAVLSGSIDFAISLVLLFALMLYKSVPFTINLLLIPLFFLYLFAATCAMAFWLSALNVKYRDVKYIVPFIVRIGMFICPVMFLSSKISPEWKLFVYSTANPLSGIFEGFRWAVFGHDFQPYWPGFWPGFGLIVVLLISGAYYFRSTEKTFADII